MGGGLYICEIYCTHEHVIIENMDTAGFASIATQLLSANTTNSHNSVDCSSRHILPHFVDPSRELVYPVQKGAPRFI